MIDDPSSTFQNLPLQIPDEVIEEIYRQAWIEALAEARQLLKQRMVQAILDRTLASSPGLFGSLPEQTSPAVPDLGSSVVGGSPVESLEPVAVKQTASFEAQPASPALDQSMPEMDAQKIQAEIESIRQKLIQNKQILQQIKSPPVPLVGAEPLASAKLPELTATGTGYYVYCVRSNHAPVPDLPKEGIDPAYPLYTITGPTLLAVVSQVSLQEYGENVLDLNLHNPVWLESRARRHQDLLEQLCSGGNIVPLRFCTIFLSQARVDEMLALHEDDFIKAIEHLAGKREWGVKAYYNKDVLSKHIEATNETVLKLKANETGKSSGQAYFTRKKLAQTTLDEVEHASDACAQDSHNRLSAWAVATSLLSVQTREVSGKQEEMVFNGAYLIDNDKIDLFRAELEKLGSEYGPGGFSYDFTGPWPPYNFVNLNQDERPQE